MLVLFAESSGFDSRTGVIIQGFRNVVYYVHNPHILPIIQFQAVLAVIKPLDALWLDV